MDDIFVQQESTQKLAQIDQSRQQLVTKLRKGHKAPNEVRLIGTYRSATSQSIFDEFSVVTQGTSDATADDLNFFISLGCTVSSKHGRTVILHCDHSKYDKRMLKLDMTTSQMVIVGALMILACFLVVVGLSLK